MASFKYFADSKAELFVHATKQLTCSISINEFGESLSGLSIELDSNDILELIQELKAIKKTIDEK
jgi:hypothetical protein